MKPFLVILLIAHLATVGAGEIIKSHFEGDKSSDEAEELTRALSVVDVSDRKLQTWWDEFAIAWSEYELRVKQDPSLYCSEPEKLLSQLKDLKQKIDLVLTGLAAKETQLKAIRNILEHAELGGKSGLHCEEDPEQAICKVLDNLDKQAADERTRLNAEMKLVQDEKVKVENYPCNCEYNDWAGAWGACSVSCADGIKKETRSIKFEKRNEGKDCDPKLATRTAVCNEGCCPRDCVWGEWSEWTDCPEVLEPQPQFEHAYRSVLVEHECSERGGQACVGETKMSRKCNILEEKNEIIAEKDKKIKDLENELKGLKEACPGVQPIGTKEGNNEDTADSTGKSPVDSKEKGSSCKDELSDCKKGGCEKSRYYRTKLCQATCGIC